MRYWKVVAISLAVLVVGLAPAASVARSPYDKEELRLLKLINDHRRENGLKPLLLSDRATVAAERHSKDMGNFGFFSHYSARSEFYPRKSAPWDRMAAEGYDYNTATGENIAAGFEPAERAFGAWRESPGHNRAMLGKNYRVIGVARVRVPGSPYKWYWTTDFGGHVDPSAHHAGSGNRDRSGVENRSMNGGRIWDQRAADGAGLITRNGWARMGGYNDGRDELSQKVRLEGGSRLVYRLRVSTEERRHPYDMMTVRLLGKGGKPLAVLERHTDADAGDWRQESVKLSRYAKRFTGRAVRIEFLARTDEAKPTTFYVDSVRIQTGK